MTSQTEASVEGARPVEALPVLRARELVRVHGAGTAAVAALRGVDLEVAPGEFLALTGPSGSGKSTLLHLLGGLDRPDQGEVWFDGVDLATLAERDLAHLRRRRMGFVLQFFNLMPTLSAAENVAFPLLLDDTPQAMERARLGLESVGLGDRADSRSSLLSGGEQQRVALARALVTNPTVVLADEPTGNLDSLAGEEVLTLLRRAADAGQTIVMVTHDARSAAYADRVLRLVDGRIVGSTPGSS